MPYVAKLSSWTPTVRAIAKRPHISLGAVQHWLARAAAGEPLGGRSCAPKRQAAQTSASMEAAIVAWRGSLVGVWVETKISAAFVIECLTAHWRKHGLPTFASGKPRFGGVRIISTRRLCRPSPTSFARPTPLIVPHARITVRRAWPRQAPATAICSGTRIFSRKTTETGRVRLLEQTYEVAAQWPHRLVRCECAAATRTLRFYRLRRREPKHQPLTKKRQIKGHLRLGGLQ